MRRDSPAFLRRLPNLRWFGGGCLALLYLLVATPLAPELTTLLALADRSHQVVVQQTTRGIQVVLHHDGSTTMMHRHGFVARALVLIAQPPDQGPDHVIQFAPGTVAEQAPVLTVTPGAGVPPSDFLSPADPPPFPARLLAVSTALSRPPPDGSSALLGVRSTVLLL